MGRWPRLSTQGVVIKGSIAGIEHELQERMRVGMRGAGAHLQGKQAKRDQSQRVDKTRRPGTSAR
jgi:hypothetical protein